MKQQPTTKRTAPPTARRQRPLPLSARDKVSLFLRHTLHLPTLRPDGETVAKGAFCGVLILIFALLQTTVFARFRPFGAIPDLMLPLVIAIAMTEGEKWGAVCGLIAAYVIESLGGGDFSLLVLLYMAAGYFCPIITELYLTDSVPVRIIYTVGSTLARSVHTLFCLALTAVQFDLPALISGVVLPEIASSFVMAILPHVAVHLLLHPFHKSRSERITML